MSAVFPRSSLRVWLPAFLFCLLGGVIFFSHTRHNDFPYTYHPDEDTKVRQIVTGKRNFFHPLLLIETVHRVFQVADLPRDPMLAARVGRMVSAGFTALALVALTLLAARWAGWPGGLIAAVLLTLNPLAYELAHYFKEDPALLLGLAVTLLGLDLFDRSPNWKTAAFLGLGCALATSGKYLGVITLAFALPLLAIKGRAHWPAVWSGFLGGLIVPLLVINLPILLRLEDFKKGLEREMSGATGGHRGQGRSVPHLEYFQKIWQTTSPGIFAGATIFYGWFLTMAKKQTLGRWLVFLFPLLFLAILSFSPKTAGRYLLPNQVLLSWVAAVGAGWIFQWAWAKETRMRWTLGVFAAVITAWAIFSSASDYRTQQAGFEYDARTTLRDWIDANVPPGAAIATDGRVDLQAEGQWLERKVLTKEFVADLGSLDELLAEGVSHVAVSRQSYARFFNVKFRPTTSSSPDFARRAEFYRILFAEGRKVWQTKPGVNIYLHPGMELYDIRPPAASEESPP